jgi:histidine ammonia-lyase
MPAREALARAGLSAVTLGPKEGLALLNGTQVSTALALAGLFAAERALSAAFVAGSLSIDACLGSDTPFDARIQAVRGHRGQAGRGGDLSTTARRQRDSRVAQGLSARAGPVQPALPAAGDGRLPAPDARGRRRSRHRSECGVGQSLVFAESDEILSGGNFHAEPVAFAADNLALAIAEIGALSERRTALLMDANLSGLPPFLVQDGGVNSGFMIAQVTAAALASENKSLAHPASIDSLPTSANQEDHVSMATYAARRLGPMAANTTGIVAIELLAAAQGVDLRRPLTTSRPLTQVMSLIRADVPFWDRDRAFAPDLEAIRKRVARGDFAAFAPLE